MLLIGAAAITWCAETVIRSPRVASITAAPLAMAEPAVRPGGARATIDQDLYAIALWRSPPPPEPPAVAAAPPKPPAPPPIKLELLAILEHDAGRIAAFYHPGEDAIVKAATGAMLGGYRIARVDKGEVELVQTRGARVLKLREHRP